MHVGSEEGMPLTSFETESFLLWWSYFLKENVTGCDNEGPPFQVIIVPDGNVGYYFSGLQAGLTSVLPGLYPPNNSWKLLRDKWYQIPNNAVGQLWNM